MEVHHHPQLEKKGFNYIIVFGMIQQVDGGNPIADRPSI
jgi:hypothetical protein